MTQPESAQHNITQLRGVGPQLAEKLARLRLNTVQDLLFHLPYRYEDRTRVVPIGSLRAGDEAIIEGEILLTETVYGRRRSLLCRIADGTGQLTLRFFYFSNTQKQSLQRGSRIRCFGSARKSRSSLEMIHPEYRLIDDTITPVQEHLTPVYPSTEGIQQTRLRQLTEQALRSQYSANIKDWIPESILQELDLPNLHDCLHYVHRPPPHAPVSTLIDGTHPMQQRLAFEELLAHHLALRKLRAKTQSAAALPIQTDGQLRTALLNQLPFSLTQAQYKVTNEVLADLKQSKPMLRLVQGDVGSGKTIVAALAALEVVEAGYQVAIMAPTELLAEQHLHNFKAWLSTFNLSIEWLAGRIKGKARQQRLTKIQSGETQIVIGTHALFQKDVEFAKLALLIVDEQHRFGVHQRLALAKKGPGKTQQPHQLTMTATPIPRSLAMTAYADLDHSVIDELPPGRRPINTVVVSEQRRGEIISSIDKACKTGNQVYWVCTLIEESEALQCQAAEQTALALREALPDLHIGLVHGRMKAVEKETIMQKFKQCQVHLLVATTVIEVGVDIPNASLMVIENAERLGLAQLHQLRGRVGRGNKASSCVLMYKAPLSDKAKLRLETMRQYHDGFEIAKQDLKMRGPGELLGTKQTGLVDFHIADISRDSDLLPQVKKTATLVQQQYPEAVQPLIDRWLGDKQQFHRV